MLRPVIDIAMTLLLLLSMSYEVAGYQLAEVLKIDSENFAPIVHEVIGMTLIILFLWHLWLNRWWFRNLFRGRYNLSRIVLTLVNIFLILDVLALLISGLVMSRILTPDIDLFDSGMSFARTLHMLASYWGFVIMSFHSGLNWNIMSAMMFRRFRKKDSLTLKILLNIIALILMSYGAFAFIKRQLCDYMFLISQFVFFDYEEPLIYFLLDYSAIMIFFGCLGNYFISMLRRFKL